MYFCDKDEVMLGRGGEDKKKSGISVRGFSVSGHIQLQLNWRMKKRGLGRSFDFSQTISHEG